MVSLIDGAERKIYVLCMFDQLAYFMCYAYGTNSKIVNN